MFKNKRGIGFILSVIITLVLIGLTVKIVTDIAKYKISEKDKNRFLDLVEAVNKLNPGERDFSLITFSQEGAAIIGFARNNKPITYVKDSKYTYYIDRPEVCQNFACLCYCSFLEPYLIDIREEVAANLKCSKSICKPIDVDIPIYYGFNEFKIPGLWQRLKDDGGSYEFKNGFVIMREYTDIIKTSAATGLYHPVHGTNLPFTDIHFERSKDYVAFCFQSGCITEAGTKLEKEKKLIFDSYLKAETLFKGGKYEEALKILDVFLEYEEQLESLDDASKHNVYYYKILSHVYLKQFEEALKYLNEFEDKPYVSDEEIETIKDTMTIASFNTLLDKIKELKTKPEKYVETVPLFFSDNSMIIMFNEGENDFYVKENNEIEIKIVKPRQCKAKSCICNLDDIKLAKDVFITYDTKRVTCNIPVMEDLSIPKSITFNGNKWEDAFLIHKTDIDFYTEPIPELQKIYVQKSADNNIMLCTSIENNKCNFNQEDEVKIEESAPEELLAAS